MLPAKDRARFIAACERVDLRLREKLAEAGDAVGHVYFPTGGWVSLLKPIGNQHIEVALVGDEGMVGWTPGVALTSVRLLVQGDGTALQLSAQAFERQLTLSAALRKMAGSYLYVVASQFAQTAGCNRFHVIEKRLVRWLLMTADRAHSSTFTVTQEFLAHMLGVRRAGVSVAAAGLQERGLIRYTRGKLTILDRASLEAASCDCYRANLETYRSVLG